VPAVCYECMHERMSKDKVQFIFVYLCFHQLMQILFYDFRKNCWNSSMLKSRLLNWERVITSTRTMSIVMQLTLAPLRPSPALLRMSAEAIECALVLSSGEWAELRQHCSVHRAGFDWIENLKDYLF
jgi:hypothetical protein